jgi:aryl-alcohol dehydrogenase-like predicted oxidoreductase
MAIAWCLKNHRVSTVITGASKPQQVIENMKAYDLLEKLTPEVMEKIETVLGNKPDPISDYR